MKQPDDIHLVDFFLSESECVNLLAFAEDFGFEPATVRTGNGHKLVSQVRNNERVDFEDESLTALLWDRIQKYLPTLDGRKASGLDPHLRVYKYSAGQRFKRHKDGSVLGEETQSRLSFLIFLTDDFEGGQTSFREYEGLGDQRQEIRFDVTPKTGLALLFQHEKWHEGLEVTEGVKYVLRTDVHYPLAD